MHAPYLVPNQHTKDFGKLGKALFLGIIASIWFGCNNSAREIVGELAVYRRERMSGMSLISYLGSKMTVFSLICAAQSALITLVLVAVCNLSANPFAVCATLWLIAMAGVTLGLFDIVGCG